MSKSIKEVFANEVPDLKINRELLTHVAKFERHWVNKSEDHIVFLGGVLLGTPPLRFIAADRNAWFDDILEVDDQILKDELHSLPAIVPSRNVTSDVFNISIFWLVHKIMVSNLSPREKELGMMNALRILHYRFLSSLMAHNFKFEPDKSIAEATFATLSYKFQLKVKGSWSALIDSRCEDIISKNSIHRRTLERFDNDDVILKMIADVQGRIREVVKKMVRVFHQVKDSSLRVNTKSAVVSYDGQLSVRDVIKDTSAYKRYSHDILVDRKTLIRDDLVKIISDLMYTMPDRHLVNTLEYVADNAGRRGDTNIIYLIDEAVLHALNFISENRETFRHGMNLPVLIGRLRSLYMSSRSTDPSLLKMREYSLKIVKRSVKSNNESMLASVRTGLMLYLVLRTFAMSYFRSGGSLESRQIHSEHTGGLSKDELELLDHII